MGRSKDVYKYRIEYGKCGTCGRPARQKADGTFYSTCKVCYERATKAKERKEKGHKDFRESETLCWKCKHAIPDRSQGRGCSWSKNLQPVEGWTAEEKTVTDNWHTITSYCVKKCPLYEEDEKCKRQ